VLKQIIKDEDLLIVLSTLEATHLSGAKTLEQSLELVLDVSVEIRGNLFTCSTTSSPISFASPHDVQIQQLPFLLLCQYVQNYIEAT
jgi:hypothetical protein